MIEQTEQTEQPDLWVIVEMMGRNKLAGRYSTQDGLHRVDVPDSDGGYKTKLLGNAAIFQIHFVDEAAARLVARQLEPRPIGVWELKQELKRLQAPAEPGEVVDPYDVDEEWEDPEFYA